MKYKKHNRIQNLFINSQVYKVNNKFMTFWESFLLLVIFL